MIIPPIINNSVRAASGPRPRMELELPSYIEFPDEIIKTVFTIYLLGDRSYYGYKERIRALSLVSKKYRQMLEIITRELLHTRYDKLPKYFPKKMAKSNLLDKNASHRYTRARIQNLNWLNIFHDTGRTPYPKRRLQWMDLCDGTGNDYKYKVAEETNSTWHNEKWVDDVIDIEVFLLSKYPKYKFAPTITSLWLNLADGLRIGDIKHLKLTNLDVSGSVDINPRLFTGGYLKWLKKLNTSYNDGITNEALLCLPFLESLDISNNDSITNESLSMMTNLTELNLCANEIISDEGISMLTNLTELNLCNNLLIDVPTLRCLQCITDLDLSYNVVITGNDLLSCKFSSLTSLHLRGDSIIGGESLVQLTTIRSLNLYSNLEITISTLMQLPLLTSLNISNNNTIDGASLMLLTNLTSLELADNYMIKDRHLTKLRRLKFLNIACNDMITLKSLTKMESLVNVYTFNETICDYIGPFTVQPHEYAIGNYCFETV